jgi:hypothetical protein
VVGLELLKSIQISNFLVDQFVFTNLFLPLILASPPFADLCNVYDDFYSYDVANQTWTLLFGVSDSESNRPPARYGHGFTSAGGKLYVHGGFNSTLSLSGVCFSKTDGKV